MASGKSAVMKYLKAKGKKVADCDEINASLLEKGNKGYSLVLKTFGSEIISNGRIDKKKLADLIFKDRQKKAQLESVMHPLILEEIQLLKEKEDVLYVEVPLLFETGWEIYFDESWLIVSDCEQLYQRCFETRKMNEEMVKQRLDVQMPVHQKIKKADIVIENNSTLEELYKKLDLLIERSSYE